MLTSREATDDEVKSTGIVHRVFMPADGGAGKSAVVLVHGRAGNETLMWVFSKVVEQLKPVAVAPRALQADPLGGYSWWLLEHGFGEVSPAPRKTGMADLELPLQKLETFVRSLPDVYGVDPGKMYGIGFSQGAAMLASLSLYYPNLFCGVAMLSGFIPRVVLDEVRGTGLEGLPPFFISHGTTDDTIPLARANEAKAALEEFGANVVFHTDDVGHKVGAAGTKALQNWFAERM